MSASVDVLPAEAVRYLDQLAAEIVAHGNPTGDLLAEAKAAHERRQAFTMEMHAGSTDRARKARALLGAHVYGRLVHRDAVESTMARMEAEHEHRQAIRLREELGL